MSTTSDVDNGASGDVNSLVVNGTVNFTETAAGLIDKAEWLQRQIDTHNIEILSGK